MEAWDDLLRMSSFRLGEWTVRPQEGVVDNDRETSRLEPKVMEVLVYLVAHQGRVVSKDEILSAVWPNSVVADVALSRSISEVRRVLQDDAKSPRYIETFPKRGYKWIGAADFTPPVGERKPRPAVLAGLTLVALAGIGIVWILAPAPPEAEASTHSIAVLPFDNAAADPDAEHLVAGFTEDVTNELSNISGLRVTPRASSEQLRRGTSATALGVRSVLEGSVRQNGDRVRIVVRLVDVETGTPLWTQSYDRELEEIFDIRRDLAEHTAQALRLIPTEAERERLATRPTRDFDAYGLYLKARSHYERLDVESVEEARLLLERAVERDPTFALGFAALADTYAKRVDQTGEASYGPGGVEAARRALEIDPSLPEAHKALGHALAVQGRFREAAVAYGRALELRPSYWEAMNNLAIAYWAIGEWDRAVPLRRRALELDPVRAISRANFGELLLGFGLDAEAEGWLSAALDIDPRYPGAADGLPTLDILNGRFASAQARLKSQLELDTACQHCHVLLGVIAELEGDDALATEHFERALDLAGRPTVARLHLARIRWHGDGRPSAESLLEGIETSARRALERGVESWWPRWNLAAAASIRGHDEQAVVWFRRAMEAGRRSYRWDAADPLFRGVRHDPRFVAVLDEMRSSVEEMRARLADIPRAPSLRIR